MGVIVLVRRLSERDFKLEVLKSDNKVLVYFVLHGWPYCKEYIPVLERLSKKHTDVLFVCVDIYDKKDVAERFEICNVPMIIFFDKGNEVCRSKSIDEDFFESIL